jgi:Xaa-Pro aminopeptidase
MFEKIAELQEVLSREKLDALVVTNSANIFYLTSLGDPTNDRGFFLIVSKNSFKLITSIFYQFKVEGKVPEGNLIIVQRGNSCFQRVLEELKDFEKVGFEKEDLSYSEYEILKKSLGEKKMVFCSELVEKIREIKTAEEIEKISRAAAITDKAFCDVLAAIKPGVTEMQIKQKIIGIMEDEGADGVAFEPIVASGKGSADPHYRYSRDKIEEGEMVLLDIGAKYKCYCADLSRTVFIGKAPERFKKLYNIVLETQEMAIAQCREGVAIKECSLATIENFRKYGEDEFFIHSLGHGVGVEVHDFPFINPKNENKFKNGMVFAIEPGLYHGDFGGIRIEDLCLIDGECRLLSKAPKNIIEL